MNEMGVSAIVFMCVFGGGLLGMLLRASLPEHHLSSDSRDVVKLGMGVVGTLTALVLGLLVASAKGSFDAQSTELTQLATNVVLLDRTLAHYGPESQDARNLLRGVVARMVDRMWSTDPIAPSSADSPSVGGEALYDKLHQLSPKDDVQRGLQTQALNMAIGLTQTRWLMFEQRTTAVSAPLLIVVVLWLTVILASVGLFAPANATVVTSLGISALAVSGAVFLILEMYAPYTGLIQISRAPLRAALAVLGQ